jgi:hypothetical protein
MHHLALQLLTAMSCGALYLAISVGVLPYLLSALIYSCNLCSDMMQEDEGVLLLSCITAVRARLEHGTYDA